MTQQGGAVLCCVLCLLLFAAVQLSAAVHCLTSNQCLLHKSRASPTAFEQVPSTGAITIKLLCSRRLRPQPIVTSQRKRAEQSSDQHIGQRAGSASEDSFCHTSSARRSTSIRASTDSLMKRSNQAIF